MVVEGLAVALITNTWLNGSLFHEVRKKLQEQLRSKFLGIIARGALCRYCVSHWVALGVALMTQSNYPWWLEAAALTMLGNVFISLYALLSTIHGALSVYTQKASQ